MCCTRVQSPQEERQPAKHNPRGRQQPAPRCARAARSGPARVVVGLLVVLTPLQVTGYGLKCRSLALSHDGATQLSFQVSTYGMTNWVYVAEDGQFSFEKSAPPARRRLARALRQPRQAKTTRFAAAVGRRTRTPRRRLIRESRCRRQSTAVPWPPCAGCQFR